MSGSRLQASRSRAHSERQRCSATGSACASSDASSPRSPLRRELAGESVQVHRGGTRRRTARRARAAHAIAPASTSPVPADRHRRRAGRRRRACGRRARAIDRARALEHHDAARALGEPLRSGVAIGLHVRRCCMPSRRAASPGCGVSTRGAAAPRSSADVARRTRSARRRRAPPAAAARARACARARGRRRRGRGPGRSPPPACRRASSSARAQRRLGRDRQLARSSARSPWRRAPRAPRRARRKRAQPGARAQRAEPAQQRRAGAPGRAGDHQHVAGRCPCARRRARGAIQPRHVARLDQLHVRGVRRRARRSARSARSPASAAPGCWCSPRLCAAKVTVSVGAHRGAEHRAGVGVDAARQVERDHLARRRR